MGGHGPNTYDLEKAAALIIHLGGNDTYRGTIGASPNSDLGNSVVIDLSGNDTYQPAPLGLAAGRAGIGIVIDHSGDDTYRLAPGSGGVGLAGLGILYMEKDKTSTKETGSPKGRPSAGSAYWWIAPETTGIPASATRWASELRWVSAR